MQRGEPEENFLENRKLELIPLQLVLLGCLEGNKEVLFFLSVVYL